MNAENEICCATEPQETKELERFKPYYTSEYSDEAWEVKIAMPGVEKSGLDVSIENEILSVTGLRKVECPENWKRLSGSGADRQYELKLDVGPEVDGSRIEAKLENGELAIRLPLKEEAKPKHIPVT